MRNKSLHLFFALLCLFPSIGRTNNQEKKMAKKSEAIVLTAHNTVAIRGVIDAESSARYQMAIMAMAAQLKPRSTVYAVLDTPGGSVLHGREMVATTLATPLQIRTVAVYAASMGFHFLQGVNGERLVVPNAILMSHRAYVNGLGGEIPGELLTQINFLMRMLNLMDLVAASRMEIPVNRYQAMIRDEYWITAEDAVKAKAADQVVLARCDKSLMGTTKVKIGSFFGHDVFGVMSKCPLITGIIGVELEQRVKSKSAAEALKIGHLYKNNKKQFITDWIISGKLNQ